MLIDAHSHPDRFDLEGDQALRSALAEITEHQILTVANSLDVPSYWRNQEIAAACDLVLPAFGVHPWYAPQYAGRLHELDTLLEGTPLIGEAGLDHHFVEDAAEYPAQEEVLRYQLEAAADQDKIVTLHTKGAEREVLEVLDRYRLRRVIVHWYSGPLDVFREMAARGAYFTVGVEVLFSEQIRAIAREIPTGRLLTETDNPGGPKNYLGRAGTPLLVKQVIQGLAEARGTTAEVVEEEVRRTFLEIAKGDPRLADAYRRVLAG